MARPTRRRRLPPGGAGRLAPLSARPALFTRPFLLLLGGQLLQALGYSSMILLPLLLSALGATRAQIGLYMTGIPALVGLLSRPLVGWALDRLGRRPTLIAGTLLLVLGMELLFPVRELGAVLVLARVAYGLGVALLGTAYFTWAADLVPLARRTEGLALFGIAGLLPLALNPLVGGLGISGQDLGLYFPAVGLVIACSLLLVARLPEPAREPAPPLTPRALLTALGARPLLPVWLATAAFASLVAGFMSFATVAAAARGVPRPAELWFTYAGGAIAVRLLGAWIPDRVGPANLVAPALSSYCAAFLVAARADDAGGFLLASLLAGVGHGYCFPVLAGQVVSRTPPGLRGSALSAFWAPWFLAELVVAPALGRLADATHDGFMLTVAACAAAACLVPWAALEHALGPARAGA